MTDEQNSDEKIVHQAVEEQTEQNPAHPVDENPEEHLGEATADPWNDESQTDWPNGSVDYPEVNG